MVTGSLLTIGNNWDNPAVNRLGSCRVPRGVLYSNENGCIPAASCSVRESQHPDNEQKTPDVKEHAQQDSLHVKFKVESMVAEDIMVTTSGKVGRSQKEPHGASRCCCSFILGGDCMGAFLSWTVRELNTQIHFPLPVIFQSLKF